jgi:hypothetical protein
MMLESYDLNMKSFQLNNFAEVLFHWQIEILIRAQKDLNTD